MRRRPCLHSTCRRGLKLLGTDSSPCFSKSEHLVLARPAPARRRRRGPLHSTPGSRARWLLLQLCGLLPFQLYVLFPRRISGQVSPLVRPPRATLLTPIAVPVARAARRCLVSTGSSPLFLSVFGPARAARARRGGRGGVTRKLASWRLAFLGLSGPCWVFAGAPTRREQALTVLRDRDRTNGTLRLMGAALPNICGSFARPAEARPALSGFSRSNATDTSHRRPARRTPLSRLGSGPENKPFS
jgi:hypothetical protein